MEAIAWGIGVAGVAYATSLSLGYLLNYLLEKKAQKLYEEAIKDLVEENKEQIIENVEGAFTTKIAHFMEQERLARKREEILHV
ncbi:hypothetical protein P4V86_03235 [Brevibacillus laterosporus]|uniref:hypothetical protein n=1 Tax=Brevibacillus laterosporus TaxID=1465 RepID=UPI00036C405D|nr:hypothetical protein [Brevibacillus laterosporus]ATO48537.1 hypothetical protein BrL25_05070 [Brevibacillus laterosporus DSM 25]MED2002371.1 hypothetical protein [Brevibacillus laterosporus]